jgi:hypothetical protein
MANRQTTTDERIIEAIDGCTSLIEAGAGIGDCLKLYPDLEERELRQIIDLVEAALAVKKAYPESMAATPTKRYIETGRRQFLAAIGAKGEVEEQQPAALFPSRVIGLIRNAYTVTAAAAAAIIVLAGGLVHYSSDSLPGSALYTVKRMTETAQLAFTFDENSKARLHYELAQKRIAEVDRLIKSGNESSVSGVNNIYDDAKENLSEASEIAKANTGGNKAKLKENIDNLNKTIKEQSTKLAARLNNDNEKTSGSGKADDKSADNSGQSIPENTGTTMSGSRIADSGAVIKGLDDSANSKEVNADDSAQSVEGKDNGTTAKENDAANENSKNGTRKRSLSAGTKTGNTDNKEELLDETAREKVTASMAPFEVDAVRVSDRSFSPNKDGVKDMVRVSVDGASSETFSVGIYQNSAKIVTILEQSSGKNADMFWNGEGQNGGRLPDGEYTVKVSDNLGQFAHKKAEVVIDTKAPHIEVVGPPNGIKTYNQTPQFIWKDSEGVNRYYLHIEPESGSADGKKTIANITNIFYEPSEKLSPGLWTWCVIAIDEAGNVGTSPYAELTIELSGQQDTKAKILKSP